MDTAEKVEYTKLTSVTWGLGLLQTLNTMRKNQELCDVRVILEGGLVLNAHSCVLSASSPFIKTLLIGTTNPELNMESFPCEITRQIIEFMYTGSACIKQSDLLLFHSIAGTLNISSLAEMARKLIQKGMTKKEEDENTGDGNSPSKYILLTPSNSQETDSNILMISTKKKTSTGESTPHMASKVLPSQSLLKSSALTQHQYDQSSTSKVATCSLPQKHEGLPEKDSDLERKDPSITALTMHDYTNSFQELCTEIKQEKIEESDGETGSPDDSELQASELQASDHHDNIPEEGLENAEQLPESAVEVLSSLLNEGPEHPEEVVDPVAIVTGERNMKYGEMDAMEILSHQGAAYVLGNLVTAADGPTVQTAPGEITLEQRVSPDVNQPMRRKVQGMARRQAPTHHGLTYLCEICNKCFTDEGVLERHREKHREIQDQVPKRFPCSYCEFSSNYQFALNEHIRLHTGEKPFKCQQCDATFTHKKSWQVHQIRHSGKKFECTQCGKNFNALLNLRKHVKYIHMPDVRPYKCHICSRCFKINSSLNRHMRTHANKAINCSICSKVFFHESNLQDHIKRRHQPSEKRYKCDKCSKSYKCRQSILTHICPDEGDFAILRGRQGAYVKKRQLESGEDQVMQVSSSVDPGNASEGETSSDNILTDSEDDLELSAAEDNGEEEKQAQQQEQVVKGITAGETAGTSG